MKEGFTKIYVIMTVQKKWEEDSNFKLQWHKGFTVSEIVIKPMLI